MKNKASAIVADYPTGQSIIVNNNNVNMGMKLDTNNLAESVIGPNAVYAGGFAGTNPNSLAGQNPNNNPYNNSSNTNNNYKGGLGYSHVASNPFNNNNNSSQYIANPMSVTN